MCNFTVIMRAVPVGLIRLCICSSASWERDNHNSLQAIGKKKPESFDFEPYKTSPMVKEEDFKL